MENVNVNSKEPENGDAKEVDVAYVVQTEEVALVPAEARVLVKEDRINLERKFKFGTDLEEFFLLLESRCVARNLSFDRYLYVLVDNCEDVASIAVGALLVQSGTIEHVRDQILVRYGPANPLAQYRAALLSCPAAPAGESMVTHSYLWVRKHGLKLERAVQRLGSGGGPTNAELVGALLHNLHGPFKTALVPHMATHLHDLESFYAFALSMEQEMCCCGGAAGSSNKPDGKR
eukprot:Trichotokara_eunicae@DN6309_c0_g1_i5.p1